MEISLRGKGRKVDTKKFRFKKYILMYNIYVVLYTIILYSIILYIYIYIYIHIHKHMCMRVCDSLNEPIDSDLLKATSSLNINLSYILFRRHEKTTAPCISKCIYMWPMS